MKRRKKSLLLILLSAFLVALFTLGSPKKSDAATAGVVDVNFQTYDSAGLAAAQAAQDEAYWKQDIEAYVKALASNIADGWSYGSEVGVSAAKAFRELKQLTAAQIIAMDSNLNGEAGSTLWNDNSSFTVNVSSSKDSTKTLQEVWGNISSAITESVSWNVTTTAIHNWNGFTAWGKTFATPTSKTTFATGDSVYLAVFVSSATKVKNTVVGVDFKTWITSNGENPSQVSYCTETNGTVLQSNQTPLNYVLNCGFTTDGTMTIDNYLLGYFTLPTNTVNPGTYTLGMSATGYSTWRSDDNSISCNGAASARWNANTVTFTIGGSMSNTTNMNNPTYKTDSITSATSTTGAGTSASPYASSLTPALNASDSNLYLTLDPTDNATIKTVKYSTTSTTAAQGGTSATKTSTNNYSIPLSSVGAGDTMYVAIEVESQDGSNTKWYYLALSKPASTVKTLDSFSLSTKNSSSAATPTTPTPSSMTSGITTTTNVTIGGDATTVDFTFAFTGKRATIDGQIFNNTNPTSSMTGNTHTVTIGTTAAPSVTIAIEDTAGNTVNYVFNFTRRSTSTTPTVTIASFVGSTADTNKTVNSYDSSGNATASGFAYAANTLNITATASNSGSIVSINGTTYSGPMTGVSYPSTNKLVVICKDESGLQHTYTINLSKSSASNDTGIKNVSFTQGSTNGTFTSSDGTTYTSTSKLNDASAFTLSFAKNNANATILDVRWSTTSATAAETGTVVSGSSPYSITPTGLAAGGKVYVAVKMQAQDGTTAWKYIEIERKPDTTCTLDSYTITSNSPKNNANLGDAYSSSASSFAIKIAGDATSANFILTFTGASATLDGTSYTGGSTVNIPVTGTSKTVSFVVQSQDPTVSKTYTFNITKLSIDGKPTITFTPTPTATAVTVNSSDITESNFKGTASKSGFPFATTAVSVNVTPPTGGTVVKINSTSGSSLSNVPFTTSPITVKVYTKDESQIEHEYTITLSKDAASSTININNVKVNGNNAGVGTAANVAYQYLNLPNTTTSATIGFDVTNNGTVNGVFLYDSVADILADVSTPGSATGSSALTPSGANYVANGLSAGMTKYVAVFITAEDGTKGVQIIQIATAASSTSSVTNVTASDGTNTLNVTKVGNTYTVDYPTSVSTVTLTVTFIGASVTDGSTTPTTSPATFTVSPASSITLTPVAADGTSGTPVTVAFNPLSDLSQPDVTIQKNGSTTDNVSATSWSSSKTATISVPYEINTIRAMVTSVPSGATLVSIEAQTLSLSAYCNNKTFPNNGFAASSMTITIVVRSQVGRNDTYVLTVNRLPANTVVTPTPPTGGTGPTYPTPVPSGYDSVLLYKLPVQPETSTTFKIQGITTGSVADGTPATNGKLYGSLANALANTSVLDTVSIIGGEALVTLGATGTSVFYAVEFTAQDTSHKTLVIYEVPRASSNNSNLDNIVFTATSPTTTNVPISPAFTSSVTTYTITVPMDATALALTPTFGSTKTASAYDSSTYVLTSGSTQTVNHNASQITVTVVPQSGGSGTTYTFNIVKKSTDASIASIKVDGLDASGNSVNPTYYTAVYNPTTNEWVVSNVPYAVKSFKAHVTPTNSAATITIDSVAASAGWGPTKSITNAVNPADQTPGDDQVVVVTAEDGVTTVTTRVVVKRAAADTDNGLIIDKVEVFDGTSFNAITGSMGATVGTTATWTATSNVPFDTTSAQVTFTLSSAKSTVTYETTTMASVTTQQTGAPKAFGTSSNVVTLTITIAVRSEAGVTFTYYVKITRDGANANTSYNFTVSYTDVDGSSISNVAPPDSTNPLAFAIKQLNWVATATEPTTSIVVTQVKSNSGGLSTATLPITNISGISQFLALNAPKYTSGNFIIYEIELQITPQSGASVTCVEKIYVTNPTSNKTLSKWDLIVPATGLKAPTSQPSPNLKKYDLAPSEGFYLDLEVLNDPTGLTKIYTSTTNYPSSTFPTNGNIYNPTDTYNPGDTVYIYVQAEDGTDAMYTVQTSSTTPKQAGADIDTIDIDNKSALGDLGLFNYVMSVSPSNLGSYTVPYDVKELKITVTPLASTSDKATAHSSSSIPVLSTQYTLPLASGSNTINIQLQAENGTAGTLYTFDVTRTPAQTYNLLTDLTIDGTPVPKDSSTGLYPDNINVLINRYAVNGTFNLISVMDGTNDKAFFKLLNGSLASSPEIASAQGQKINQVFSGLTAGQVKVFSILVYSEKDYVDGTGTFKHYIVRLFPADDTFTINYINLLDMAGNDTKDINGNAYAFNSSTNSYTFTVPFKVDNTTAKVTVPTGFVGSVKINGNVYTTNELQKTLVEGTGLSSNKFTIEVSSEYRDLLIANGQPLTLPEIVNQVQTYEIQIDRQSGSTANTLNSLSLDHNGNPMALDTAFVPDDNMQINYSVSNATIGGNSIIITVKPTDKNASLDNTTGPWIANGDGTYSKSYDVTDLFTGGVSSKALEIKVYAEADTTKTNPLTYKVTISKTSVTKDTNHTVTLIEAEVGTPGVQVLGDASTTTDQTFVTSTYKYTINLSNPEASTRINVTFPSTATIYVDGTPMAATAPGYWSGVVNLSGSTQTVKIQCVAESGLIADSSTYEIEFNQPATDNTTTLDSWLAYDPSSATPTSPIKDLLPYDGAKIYLPNSYVGKTLDFTAGTTSPRTIIESGTTTYTETKTLALGSNMVTVTVKAQTGVTKTYTVDVVVNGSLELATISIIDDNGNTVFFDYDPATDTFTPIPQEVDYVNLHYDSNKTVIYVPNSVTKVRYNATLKDAPYDKFDNASGNQFSPAASAYVNLGNGSLTTPSLTLTAVVADQEGNTRSYVIDIMRIPGSNDKDILSYTEEGQTTPSTSFQPSGSSYEYLVNTSITSFNPEANWVLSTGATFKIKDSTGGNNRVLNIGKNVFTVEIYSENEPNINPHGYTITVWKANNDYQVNDIEFLKSATSGPIDQDPNYPVYAFNPTTLTYDIYVPYSVDSTYLRVTLNDSVNAIYKLNGNPFTNTTHLIATGNNTFAITSVSQYGQLNPSDTTRQTSETYNIVIHRAMPSTDATLKDLQIYAFDAEKAQYFDFISGKYYAPTETPGSLPTTLTPPANSIIVSQIDSMVSTNANITQCTISGFTTDPNAKIISGVGVQTFLLNGVSGTTTWTFNIVVEAEDGVTRQTYTVTLTKEIANPDKDNSIKNISVVAKGKEYILSFNEATTKYTVTIPYGPDSYSVSAQTNLGSSAQIFIDTVTNPMKTVNPVTNTLSLTDCGTTVKYYIQAEAKDKSVGTNGRGTEYEVEITFGMADSDNSLKDIKVDGTLVPGFDPSVLDYYINVPFATSSVDVSAVCSSIKGKIVSGVGTVNLVAGDTTHHSVVVQAEDGTIRTYNLHISRDSENPYFADLDVPGYNLLDPTTETPVPFDPTAPGFDSTNAPIVQEYRIVVPYTQATGSINIKVPDGNYTTTISQTGQSIYNGINRTFDNLVFDVGPNGEQANTEFLINGTSPAGKTVVYKITVTRLGKASADTNMIINTVDAFDKTNQKGSLVENQATELFKDEWKIGVPEYNYSVSNKVMSLKLSMTPSQPKATVKVYGADTLQSGKVNDVAVVITAEDGMTTKAYVLHVYREPMEYDVNLEGNAGNAITKIEDPTSTGVIDTYELNIGQKKLSEITNKPEEFFKNYIEFDEDENAITVQILSDLSAEDVTQVIMKVTDGTEEKYIAINIVSELGFFGELTSGVGGWLMIGGVLVCVVLLCAILVAVNKDKYGKVADKRKKA